MRDLPCDAKQHPRADAGAARPPDGGARQDRCFGGRARSVCIGALVASTLAHAQVSHQPPASLCRCSCAYRVRHISSSTLVVGLVEGLVVCWSRAALEAGNGKTYLSLVTFHSWD